MTAGGLANLFLLSDCQPGKYDPLSECKSIADFVFANAEGGQGDQEGHKNNAQDQQVQGCRKCGTKSADCATFFIAKSRWEDICRMQEQQQYRAQKRIKCCLTFAL